LRPLLNSRAGTGGLRTTLSLAVCFVLPLLLSVPARAEAAASATAARLSGDKTRTKFSLDLSAGVMAEIYTLANPYRVIVDLPDVSFRLADGTGQKGTGLVRTFRYGLFAEKKARIVLDTTGPVRIEHAGMTAEPNGRAIVFTFDMVTTAPESFGMGTGADRATDEAAPSSAPEAGSPGERSKSKHAGKPIIMIDPGHGGIDGGAVSAANVLEKNVVLAVGKELARQLNAGGRYDVRLTRQSDVFISLDQRLKLSLQHEVDLFISLHADSLAEAHGASSIRGATVYTLSERASDEHARRMAEKENNSDAVAGLSVTKGHGDDEVNSILFDLMKRETANFSTDFSNALIKTLKKTNILSRVPKRAAAFKVLKQTHAPSVLIELGYLSHPEDEKLLNTPAWHRQTATSIAQSVDAYFAKRTAGSPAP
jgi:N-acetylmuramoyl-L-alanine amidase